MGVLLFPKVENLIAKIIPLFTTTYTGFYQITMPVVFEIYDKDNSDIIFQFGVETNIENNKPLKFKEKKEDDIYFEEDNSDAQSLICDPNQFISGVYNLTFFDNIENGKRKNLDAPLLGVDGALVSFSCKGFSKCFLGETKINGKYKFENFSHLNFKLPINCNPTTLEIYKFGHKKIKIENLNPQIGKNVDLGNFSLDSTKKLKLEVNLCKGVLICSSGRSLDKEEQGFIFFNNLENSELTRAVSIDFENQNKIDVELTTGNYSISAFILDSKNVSIPGKEICVPKSGVSGVLGEEECHQIPDINLSSWVSGNYEISNFEIKKEDLIGNSEIFLKIKGLKAPTTLEEFENLQSNSKKDVPPSFRG